MSKSKNSCQKNESAKAHRNGIKKIARKRVASKKGMCMKYTKNLKAVRAGNARVMRAKREAALAAA